MHSQVRCRSCPTTYACSTATAETDSFRLALLPVCLIGAIEYQELHRDGIYAEPYDPQGKLKLVDYPVPVVTINFQMCDTDPTNGPIRQIPGTHHTHEPIPKMDEEPPWMKLSTVCPAPAGTGIFRDNRCWHVSAIPTPAAAPPQLSPMLLPLAVADFSNPTLRYCVPGWHAKPEPLPTSHPKH